MAWKREEPQHTRDANQGSAPPPPAARVPASLGSSITIKGDLTGEEDLTIAGSLEGNVRLGQHSVTISRSGRLKADVWGKRVVVEGEVQGNLYGSEEVVIRKDGRAKGSAISPRVTLESGANFRGHIDMQPESVEKAFGSGSGAPQPPPRRPGAPAPSTAEKPEPEKAAPARS